jgi:uncharacterized membrane protein required for colicin V production
VTYDVIVLFFLVCGLLAGAWKGAALQLAGLASVTLGFVGAAAGTHAIVGAMAETPPLRGFLIFVACFALISLCFYLLAIRFRKKLEEKDLGGWDRRVGALLGSAHGGLLCMFLTLFAVVLVPSLRAPILDRPAGRAMAKAIRVVHSTLPERVQEAIRPALERAQSG